MRSSTYKTLLVLADISGFTQFMKSHENAGDHAMHVVVELLRAVIAAAAPPLKLAEVEGDAAFFYAIYPENGDARTELAAIKKQVKNFFRSFDQTLQRLCASYPCACDAKDLRLKVVIHAGEVALEHIHGFDKLFGMDVILAHRLLKNSVPSQEYVLMSEAAHNWLGDFHGMESQRQTEYYEGIGVVDTVIFYPQKHYVETTKPQPPIWRPRPEARSRTIAGAPLTATDLLIREQGKFWTASNDHRLSKPAHYQARAQPAATVWIAQVQTKWRREVPVHLTARRRQGQSAVGLQ